MRRLDPQAHFDTVKFNSLMAECTVNGAELFG